MDSKINNLNDIQKLNDYFIEYNDHLFNSTIESFPSQWNKIYNKEYLWIMIFKNCSIKEIEILWNSKPEYNIIDLKNILLTSILLDNDNIFNFLINKKEFNNIKEILKNDIELYLIKTIEFKKYDIFKKLIDKHYFYSEQIVDKLINLLEDNNDHNNIFELINCYLKTSKYFYKLYNLICNKLYLIEKSNNKINILDKFISNNKDNIKQFNLYCKLISFYELPPLYFSIIIGDFQLFTKKYNEILSINNNNTSYLSESINIIIDIDNIEIEFYPILFLGLCSTDYGINYLKIIDVIKYDNLVLILNDIINSDFDINIENNKKINCFHILCFFGNLINIELKIFDILSQNYNEYLWTKNYKKLYPLDMLNKNNKEYTSEFFEITNFNNISTNEYFYYSLRYYWL